MPGTDTLKLFQDAFNYNKMKFVKILVKVSTTSSAGGLLSPLRG